MKRAALCVGVDRYTDQQLHSLACAEHDAIELHALFQHRLGFDHCALLRSPDSECFVAKVEELVSRLSPGDLFVLFFAGHGFSLEAQHLLLCREARLNRLKHRFQTVPLDLLKEETNRAGLHRLFVLDSCRTDLLRTRQAGAAGFQGEAVLRDLVCRPAAMEADAPAPGALAILQSCAEGGQAAELPALNGGLFRLALTRVLTAAVDTGRTLAVDEQLKREVQRHMTQLAGEHGLPAAQQPTLYSASELPPLVPGWGELNKAPKLMPMHGSGCGEPSPVSEAENLSTAPTRGAIYQGKVVWVGDYGVIVEFLPRNEGLVHYTELINSDRPPKETHQVGDVLTVKLIGRDEKGRFRLSQHQAAVQSQADAPAGKPFFQAPSADNSNVMGRLRAKAERRQQAEVELKARFDRLTGEFGALRMHPHLTPEEVLEAWRELCRELEVADAPEAPGELAWEGRQVVVVRRQREAELRHRSPADATKNQPWGNSLGMRFVPVPRTEVLFSIWPTRVQDFQEFVSAVGMDWSAPPFEQGPTHPAVDVSWNDAQAFCQWLTKKERGARWLTRDQHYRLPKDWEWSVAVGLFETREGVPKDRDEKCERAYPWGTQWPPPWGAGNYGRSLSVDSFDYTSPVGAFTPNEVGLFDLGGNVWEWCEDYYDGERERRVSRGGSWTTQGPTAPLSSYRNTQALLHATGFRVVVAREDSHS